MLAPSRYCIQQKIDIAASTNVLAAASGLQYKIYWLWLVNTTATTTIQFKDGTTALTGVITFGTNGQSLVLPFTGEPWFICTQGNSFTITLGATTQVSGALGWNN